MSGEGSKDAFGTMEATRILGLLEVIGPGRCARECIETRTAYSGEGIISIPEV